MAKYRRLVAGDRRSSGPHVAVLIDFPDVNFRLARELKKLGVPVVCFVSPQLWAWKRRRLRWVQERVDRMMVIFPFEETFYRARGVKAEFVGHPLAEVALWRVRGRSMRQERCRRSRHTDWISDENHGLHCCREAAEGDSWRILLRCWRQRWPLTRRCGV